MPFRRLVPLLALSGLALAGCASEAEIRQAQQAQAEADRFSCLERGFEQDSESLALCQLILQTNRRLDVLSRRLAFLENDVQRLDLLGSPFRRCCWARAANRVLMARIGHLLARSVGRPSTKPPVFFVSFAYRAQSWTGPRRVVAKVERHPRGAYPRVGVVITSPTRPAERVVRFSNGRGAAEQ